jgi:phosphotransferase system HPr-like phosphotransfer protein
MRKINGEAKVEALSAGRVMLTLKAGHGEQIGVELSPDDAAALAGALQKLVGVTDGIRTGMIVTK